MNQSIISKISKLLRDPLLPFRLNCWGVGLINNYSPDDILNDLKKIHDIHWIEANSAGDFYADPFITDHFGDYIVFFENYVDKLNKGNISYVYIQDFIEHSKEIQKYIHTALDLPTHLSYPYLFKYNGDLYMVPENYRSHTISLYKSDGSPDNWYKVTELITDFDGIDTNIFEYNGKWWMFSTLNIENTKSEESDLFIWHSDSPLGNWKPHPLNPITEERIARGAGYPFIINGELYRPAQDCRRKYGGELLVKKVNTLTISNFDEDIIMKLTGFPPFENSFHTFWQL